MAMLEVYDCFPTEWGGYPDQANTVGGDLITSFAGGRPDPITGAPSWHSALDLITKFANALLFSVVPMRIYQSWDPGGGGWWSRGEATKTLDVFGYGHATGSVPYGSFAWGEKIEAGVPIAIMGTSGHSTGVHVHFAQKASSSAGWGDPYPSLLRTAQAGRYPGAPPPDTKPPIPTPLPQEEDMPMQSYELSDTSLKNGNGETWVELAGGPGLGQLVSPSLANKMRSPVSGHPAPVVPVPIKLDVGEMESLLTLYFGPGFAKNWRNEKEK